MMKKKREGMNSMAAQSACQTRCEKNPTCCTKRNALCFAKPFKPPLIGPQKDFCNQAVGRGIPVPNCELGKPVTFIYPRSVFYGLEKADKPGSSPELKNWKKWCTVWNSNQTALRETEVPPSIMTCGEGWRRKLEDQELVERTLHAHHMYGFNIPNTLYPNPIAPGKECLDIQETLTRRLFRDYPPMEKLRVPKTIRNEMHLPQRHPPREGKDDSTGQYWKWEKNWSNSKYLQETKNELREDIAKHGPLQPCPDKLIVQGKSMPGGQKGKRKVKSNDPFGLAYPIPQIIFSQDSDGPLYQSTTIAQDPEFRIPLYEEKRGPVLYIEGRTFQVLLKKQVQTPTEAPLRENQFLYDVMDGFAATTKCKEVRHICLKNQGTTAIRFQWLRAPPSTATRNLLGNPAKMLHLNLNAKKERGAVDSRPPNLLESCELNRNCGGRKVKKNVSVHLSTSAKVDPALTRTLKIMRNCATSGLAFENLLLMLALRVPRLKRLLVRRTGRQLKRRQLPLHVQQLYLKLKQKQKVERKLKECQKLVPEPELETKETAISFFDEIPGESQEFDMEDESGDAESQGLCPCQRSDPSSGASSAGFNLDAQSGDMSQASALFLQSKPKYKEARKGKPKICECFDPVPQKHHCGGDHGRTLEQEKVVMNKKCIPRTPPSTSRTEFLEYEGEGEFEYCPPGETEPSLDLFECIGEWEDIPGENNCGEGELNEIPVGATSDFYPLGYGKSLVKHNRKCRGKLVPKTEYVAPPKDDLVTWINGQRLSINEGGNPLQPSSSDESTDPNDEIFKELKGYDVRRDYDSDGQKVTIEVGLERKEPVGGEGDGESEEKGSNHRTPVIPLRPTQKTHKLNTQTLSQNDLNLQSLPSQTKPASEEFEGAPELEVFQVEIDMDVPDPDLISTLKAPVTRHTSSHSSGERGRRKVTPPPKEKVLEFLKDPCSDFHFRELPGVLLPGQTSKFPIIFRPRKPGFHYETLYLVTHPRLCEATYAVRLNGICIDPDLPTKTTQSTKTNAKRQKDIKKDAIWKTGVDKVESEMKEEMLKKQGRDLFDAIIDNVFYMSEVQNSTLPFGKVTTESIFYAHNPTLFYHHGTAEHALETVRKLVSRVVPKERLVDNNVCSLNIESLYQELSRPKSDYLWSNFKTQETEDLLSDFTHCTKILTKPNAMNAISLSDQKFNDSYYFLLTIVNEISFELVGIEQSYQTPELVDVVRASIADRFQKQEAREIKKRQREEMKKAALIAESEQLPEEDEGETEPQMIPRVDRVDVGTQKDLNDPPEIIATTTERKTSRGKETSKSGRTGKKGKNKNKAGKEDKGKSKEIEILPAVRTPSPQDDPEAIIEDTTDQNEGGENFGKSNSNQEGTFQMGNRLSRASQTEERPGSSEMEQREEEEFIRLQKLRQYQAKRVVFENILSVGIERMMCVIDNMNNMNQYKPSEYIVPEPDSHFYCC